MLLPLSLCEVGTNNNNNAAAAVTDIGADGRVKIATENNNGDKERLLNEELEAAFDDAKATLTKYNDAKAKLSTLSKGILEDQEKTSGMTTKIQKVQDMKDTISTKKKSIDSAIRDINARQISYLQEKIELLHTRELQRRTKMKEKEGLEKHRQKKRKKKLAAQSKKSSIPEGALLKEDLHDLINLKSILEKSDAELEAWLLEMVESEVENLQQELEEHVIEATSNAYDLEEGGNKGKAASSTTGGGDTNCDGATLADAVQIVQEELVKFSNDKVGMVDHLAHAKVVYHLTSSNYAPASHTYSALEDSWWYQYLPDDWERGLDSMYTDEWRKWNVAIPDFVYHTFGMTGRAKTAPPEAILQPSIQPGSCWPMEGQSGHVTLRMPYPVKVKAITIDHASKLLLNGENQRNSAPKDIRVFGYPPCMVRKTAGGTGAATVDSVKSSDYLDEYGDDDNDDDGEFVRGVCKDGLDFDIASPIVLHDFEFDLDGPSIQTFHLDALDEDDEEEEEKKEEGSCSEDTGMCSSGLDGPSGGGGMYSSAIRSTGPSTDEAVSVIRLQITDNWGNKDYTCVYRFRVHGDAIDLNE